MKSIMKASGLKEGADVVYLRMWPYDLAVVWGRKHGVVIVTIKHFMASSEKMITTV
jgi:hypothetical protein